MSTEKMSTEKQPEDLVSSAFHHVRAVAKQKFGRVPNVGDPTRSVVPRRSTAKPVASMAEDDERTIIPGIHQLHELSRRDQLSLRKPTFGATGPDGRRQAKSYDIPRFGAAVSREIATRGWEEELAAGWVMNHWAELVGEKIAQHTTVEMIKDKKVFVSTDSTAWATNLKYMQREILRVIAKKIGPNLVEELKIFPPKAPSWRKGPLHVKGRGPRDTYG